MPSAARRSLSLACALASLLVAPAAARAATVAPTQACVLDGGENLAVRTSGWLPGDPLNFALNADPLGTALADATGAWSNLEAPFTTPVLPARHRVRRFMITAADDSGTHAFTYVKVVHRTVDVPRRARPARSVRYRAYGFPSGRRVFLHVRRGTHTLGRFTLGRARGACGVVGKRLRYMPLRRWSTGNYDYWFSSRRHFKRSRALFGYRIRIYKTR